MSYAQFKDSLALARRALGDSSHDRRPASRAQGRALAVLVLAGSAVCASEAGVRLIGSIGTVAGSELVAVLWIGFTLAAAVSGPFVAMSVWNGARSAVRLAVAHAGVVGAFGLSTALGEEHWPLLAAFVLYALAGLAIHLIGLRALPLIPIKIPRDRPATSRQPAVYRGKLNKLVPHSASLIARKSSHASAAMVAAAESASDTAADRAADSAADSAADRASSSDNGSASPVSQWATDDDDDGPRVIVAVAKPTTRAPAVASDGEEKSPIDTATTMTAVTQATAREAAADRNTTDDDENAEVAEAADLDDVEEKDHAAEAIEEVDDDGPLVDGTDREGTDRTGSEDADADADSDSDADSDDADSNGDTDADDADSGGKGNDAAAPASTVEVGSDTAEPGATDTSGDPLGRARIPITSLAFVTALVITAAAVAIAVPRADLRLRLAQPELTLDDAAQIEAALGANPLAIYALGERRNGFKHAWRARLAADDLDGARTTFEQHFEPICIAPRAERTELLINIAQRRDERGDPAAMRVEAWLEIARRKRRLHGKAMPPEFDHAFEIALEPLQLDLMVLVFADATVWISKGLPRWMSVHSGRLYEAWLPELLTHDDARTRLIEFFGGLAAEGMSRPTEAQRKINAWASMLARGTASQLELYGREQLRLTCIAHAESFEMRNAQLGEPVELYAEEFDD